MEQQAKKNFLLNVLYMSVVVGLTVIVCRFLLYELFPFLLSIIIAVCAQKPSKFLSERLSVSKSICAVVLSALIYLSAAGVLIFSAYKLLGVLAGLTDFLPDFLEKISEFLQKIENLIAKNIPPEYQISFSDLLSNMLRHLTDFLADFIKNVIRKSPSFLLSSVVALVAGCYISKDFDGLCKFVKGLCSENFYNRFNRIKTIFFESVLKIVRGYIILMFITFFEVWIGLWILKIPKPYYPAFLIAVVDLLPVLGTGTVLFPWALYSAVAGNFGLFAGLLILYVVVMLIRNFLEPKIVSQQIGINPLFILLSMFLGLKLFGGVGVVIFPIILIVTIRYFKTEP